MVNQQILDYIKQQTQLGVNNEQIRRSLLANGWENTDIDEAFNTINYSIPNKQALDFSNKAPIPIWKIITPLVGIVIIGGGIYFASEMFFKPEETPRLSNEDSSQPSVSEPAETTTPTEKPAQETQSQNPEIVFADKLSSCTKYKITFIHPFTGETLEKEILGIVDGKCHYVEQMPNDGKLECKYSESERKAVAQYYKNVAMAESFGIGIEGYLGDLEKTYTIDGKVVDNPLQEAMDRGVCIISGY